MGNGEGGLMNVYLYYKINREMGKSKTRMN